MKELIGIAIFIVGMLGAGSIALREVHDAVRKAALEKTVRGMPSLTRLNRALRSERPNHSATKLVPRDPKNIKEKILKNRYEFTD